MHHEDNEPGSQAINESYNETRSFSPKFFSMHSPILGRCLRRSSTQRSVNVPSNQGSGSSSGDTPQSSPAKSRKKLTGINNVWSTIKKLSPVQKLRSVGAKRKKDLKSAALFSFSHPDVSCNDLAALTTGQLRSHDDMDVLRLTRQTRAKLTTVGESGDTSDGESVDRRTASETMVVIDERQQLSRLRQHPFYQVEIHLESGKNLLAKDSGGTSDPYVKFKTDNKVVYKSRVVPKTLNPVWDEYFSVHIDDVFQPITLKAYDHDFAFQDDYLGEATLDLTHLPFNVPTKLALNLTESGTDDGEQPSWGHIFLTATLIPKTQEEKEQFYGKGLKAVGTSNDGTTVKKLKTQQWDSVVNIILVEGRDLPSKDDNGFSDPYVKFKLANEKYKSKVISKTLNPLWNEQFDLHTFPDQSKVLEVSVYDKDFHGKDDYIGKFSINLNNLPKEETLKMWNDLEEGEGSILLVLTISGTLGCDTHSDIGTRTAPVHEQDSLKERYSLWHTFDDLDDVGHLTVKIFKAEGLMAADFSGKSDPFCVLELVNTRVQTNTEYKTLSPEWNKIFFLPVRDIHEVLEITVYDEDRDKKVEFLGKVAIPLLKVRNGESRWYTLKDKKLMGRSKGRILVEMSVVYNNIRACVRTINPREQKVLQVEQRFKRSVFLRNVSRLKAILMEFINIAKFINSCFLWESVPRSISALLIFLIVTYFFELYMVPLILLLIFAKNFFWDCYCSRFNVSAPKEEESEFIYEGFDDDDDEKDGKNLSVDQPGTSDVPFMEDLTMYDLLELAHVVMTNLNSMLGIKFVFKANGRMDTRVFVAFAAQKACKKLVGESILMEEEKKTLKEKFQTVQEVTAMVQNMLGEIASLGERIKNTFNFSVPFLSCLAIMALSAAVIVLYYIPLRYLVMAWGINKFTKKLRSPNAIPNNELLDFISRVPDNDEKLMYREYKADLVPVPSPEVTKKGKKKAA